MIGRCSFIFVWHPGSDILDRHASAEDRTEGLDVADYLLRAIRHYKKGNERPITGRLLPLFVSRKTGKAL
jgi:hypothetical protein